MPKKEEETEYFFELKIEGSSTIYTEEELIDLLYEFLKDKAEFQITQLFQFGRFEKHDEKTRSVQV